MKKEKSSYFILFLTLLLVTQLLPAAQAQASSGFRDIRTTDKEIVYLYNLGVVKGTSATTFNPEGIVTREQAAMFIGRALKLNGTPRATKFPDVSPNTEAAGYIQAAADRGIITGYSDGTFKPKQVMTRGEMAFLLTRAFNFTRSGSVYYKDIPFNSAPTSRYAVVNRLTTAGVTNGTGSGVYSPEKELTRREFAIFTARSLNSAYRVTFQNPVIEELTVTTNDLNVRRGPGTQHASIGKINTGTKVQVMGYNTGWVYAKAGSVTGYISLSYLAKEVPLVKKVVIDAGHGGSDPGAVANGLQEKEVNLDVAKRVERKLNGRGITVLMTRTDDTFLSLDERAVFGINNGADAFVSIHANAASPGVSGSETFYSASVETRSEDSKQLATFIQNRLHVAMNHPNRGVKVAEFRVISNNPLPAALLELGFITNTSDAAKLKTPEYREASAQAIADGIVDYYNWKSNQ